jgi:hypothetical protein
MTVVAASAKRPGALNLADWLIPLGLIALALIPIAGGVYRVTTLINHVAITPQNERFFDSPIPVLLHIASVSVYGTLGAFQFSAGIRRRYIGWHRVAGRVLVGAGLIAAFSGLWMAMFYAIVPADNLLLHGFRLLFGSAMAVSIVIGFIAIRQRRVSVHQAWMRRAYAIGLGAGTQAFTQAFAIATLGPLTPDTMALTMGGGWILNLALAEWLIRRRAH